VIGSRECHNPATETVLLGLVDNGISDFLFDDESPTILVRSVRKIGLKQANNHGHQPRSTSDFIATVDAFPALLEACPFAVVALTPEGTVSLWNRSAEKIYGWRREEVIGKPLPTIPANDEPEFRQLLESQLRGVAYAAKEVRRRRKDGTLIDVSLWTAPLRDQHGQIRGKLAISADVTDLHRAAKDHLELLESQRETRERAQAMERFRVLFEAAPDGIVEVDSNGRIVLLNTAAEELFGYSREELLSRSIDSLVPDQLRKRHSEHRTRYAANPVTRSMGRDLELHGRRKDGSLFPVEISLSPVKNTEGLRVMAIIRDVGERKRAELEIRNANHELEIRNSQIQEANRHKSEFLASMSHELRSPLHTIIGFAQLLGEQSQGSLTDKQKRFVDYIHRDSLHLLDLINGILDISRIEAGKLELHPESLNPFDSLSEVLSSVAPIAAAKSISVNQELCESVVVRADRLRFKQILYNLLSNALKFTPNGGTISVECSITELYAHFSVSDNGPGMPQSEQLAIFDKFYQSKSTGKVATEGTGLGLAITKHLVEQHGGRIWLESELGLGCRFHFTLPLQDGNPSPKAGSSTEA
jgi:PAS domain S-box-containing protein